MHKTETMTLIAAMRTLAAEIVYGDGVANAAIAEAADRLEALYWECISCHSTIDNLRMKIESASQILDLSNS